MTEAIDILAAYEGSCRVLAGGQSLIPMVNMRLLQPDALVDLHGVEELTHLSRDGDTLVVGAMVRYRELETSGAVAAHLPLVSRVLRHIGDRQVRNRGTIGGSLCQADPTGEIPLACLTLGATVTVAGPDGTRTIPMADLYADSYATVLDPLEVLTHVRFPLGRQSSAFLECCRRHNDFAVVSVACTGRREGGGAWRDVRVGVGGAAPTPIVADAVGAMLEGTPLEDADIEAAAAAVEDAIDPPSDIRASAAYRRHLAGVYVERTLKLLRSEAA